MLTAKPFVTQLEAVVLMLGIPMVEAVTTSTKQTIDGPKDVEGITCFMMVFACARLMEAVKMVGIPFVTSSFTTLKIHIISSELLML